MTPTLAAAEPTAVAAGRRSYNVALASKKRDRGQAEASNLEMQRCDSEMPSDALSHSRSLALDLRGGGRRKRKGDRETPQILPLELHFKCHPGRVGSDLVVLQPVR